MKQRLFVVVMLVVMGLGTIEGQQGFLKGRITDKHTGEELVGAAVLIDGTTIGTITNFMGDYYMPNLASGKHTIRVQYISYDPIVIDDFVVNSGGETLLNIALSSAIMDIGEVVVVANANRESDAILLMDQKKAVISTQSIGAQQLSIQGVSDASSALTKMSGISKEEGSTAFNVRGLGDRYNSTSLNGLSLPSNNAELKNMDLTLFSTDLLEYIAVEKNFTSGMYGDVAGANINIASKKHSGKSYVSIETKVGSNSNLFGLGHMRLQDGPGIWGFDKYSKPASQALQGRFMKSYDFDNKLNPVTQPVYPNLGLGLSGGKTFEINQANLNAFASLSYGNEYNYSQRLERKVNGSGDFRMDMEGGQYAFDTQTNGVLSLNYTKGKTELNYNSLLMNSSTEEFRELVGYKMDVVPTVNDIGLLRRSQMLRNLVVVNQFLGTHALSETSHLDIKVAYNAVRNIIPDRRFNVFITDEAGVITPGDNDAADNHRFFHQLNEDEITAVLSWTKKMGWQADYKDYAAKFSAGISGKAKTRSFEAEQFNHDIIYDDSGSVPALSATDALDDYFNDNLLGHTFNVSSLKQSYEATQNVLAGFVSLEYIFSDKWLAMLGARLEYVNQDISFTTIISPNGNNGFTHTKLLPALSLRYKLHEKANLRFASSASYTLPQFIESAPFLFENASEVKLGNPYIRPSTNYNAEVKWELFPKNGELLSVTGFGKYLVNPINKFVLASAGNEFSYANTGDWAYAIGVELEAKKNVMVSNKAGGYTRWIVSGNLSVMTTKQELNSNKINQQSEGQYNANFNANRESLQGAAPVLANASMSYLNTWSDGNKSLTASLVYGYTSDRINTIGFASIGNQVDRAVNNLDFVLNSRVRNLEIAATVKNILNQDVERIQENEESDILVRSFKRGLKFNVSVLYKF